MRDTISEEIGKNKHPTRGGLSNQTGLSSGCPRAAHGPKLKIPLSRSCVSRAIEYRCKFRRRRPSGLGALGFRKCWHCMDARTDARTFDWIY